jgi:hypothetical protein
LQVQTSFAVPRHSHRLAAVTADLHIQDCLPGADGRAYAHGAGTTGALCAASRAGIQAELLLNGRVDKIRVTSLSFAASLIMLETSCDQSEAQRFYRSRPDPAPAVSAVVRLQRAFGSCRKIDIQSGLVAGVTAVEAPPAGIPISPMSMVPSPRLYLVAQTLNKQHQVRVAKIARWSVRIT